MTREKWFKSPRGRKRIAELVVSSAVNGLSDPQKADRAHLSAIYMVDEPRAKNLSLAAITWELMHEERVATRGEAMARISGLSEGF